jgi:MFS superfamily sulfate permease-like transporter
VVDAVVILGTAALPVCMGVAVLKYRLYELNRVISRVVSYTLITVLLGGVFAGLILLATRVLPVKGSVAVAVATLVIAALFNPLRRRVLGSHRRAVSRSQVHAEEQVLAVGVREVTDDPADGRRVRLDQRRHGHDLVLDRPARVLEQVHDLDVVPAR